MRFSDKKSPQEIREQILKYNATQNMTDLERARFLGLPEGCCLREGAKIISQENLKMGINCWVGENAILDASGGLEIGDNTTVGSGVFVWTHDSHRKNIKGRNAREFSHLIIRKPTKIGNNCFIGGPSVIMPGVTVGDKCIISPLSVVYENLPARTVYKPNKNIFESMKKRNENAKMMLELKMKLAAMEKEIKSIKSKQLS